MPTVHCAHSICFWTSVDHLYVWNFTGTPYYSSSLVPSNHQSRLALLPLHRQIDQVQHRPLAPYHPYLQPPTLVVNWYSHLALTGISAIHMNDTARPLRESVRSRNTMNATKSGMANCYFGNVPLRVREPSPLHVSRLWKLPGPEAEHPQHPEVEALSWNNVREVDPPCDGAIHRGRGGEEETEIPWWWVWPINEPWFLKRPFNCITFNLVINCVMLGSKSTCRPLLIWRLCCGIKTFSMSNSSAFWLGELWNLFLKAFDDPWTPEEFFETPFALEFLRVPHQLAMTDCQLYWFRRAETVVTLNLMKVRSGPSLLQFRPLTFRKLWDSQIWRFHKYPLFNIQYWCLR